MFRRGVGSLDSSTDLGASASALLSVAIRGAASEPQLLWLLLQSGSREWTSKDRQLIEDVARVVGRARDLGA